MRAGRRGSKGQLSERAAQQLSRAYAEAQGREHVAPWPAAVQYIGSTSGGTSGKAHAPQLHHPIQHGVEDHQQGIDGRALLSIKGLLRQVVYRPPLRLLLLPLLAVASLSRVPALLSLRLRCFLRRCICRRPSLLELSQQALQLLLRVCGEPLLQQQEQPQQAAEQTGGGTGRAGSGWRTDGKTCSICLPCRLRLPPAPPACRLSRLAGPPFIAPLHSTPLHPTPLTDDM